GKGKGLMAKSKIVNDREVRNWFERGKPYSWMVEQYRSKYNIETTLSMWGNYRRRNGLPLRMERDAELIPWKVREEHRWAYALQMLRCEARRRRGEALREADISRLTPWLERLREDDL